MSSGYISLGFMSAYVSWCQFMSGGLSAYPEVYEQLTLKCMSSLPWGVWAAYPEVYEQLTLRCMSSLPWGLWAAYPEVYEQAGQGEGDGLHQELETVGQQVGSLTSSSHCSQKVLLRVRRWYIYESLCPLPPCGGLGSLIRSEHSFGQPDEGSYLGKTFSGEHCLKISEFQL